MVWEAWYLKCKPVTFHSFSLKVPTVATVTGSVPRSGGGDRLRECSEIRWTGLWMWLCIPPFLIWAGWPWANRFSSLCCSFYMYERGQDQKLEVTDLKHQLGTKGKPSIPRVSECPPARRTERLLGLHIPLVCISTLGQACRFPARSRKHSLRQCII